MIDQEIADDFYVVLPGIPWDTYVAVTHALAEYHLRHTYDRGLLEIRRELVGVSWEDYQQLLKKGYGHIGRVGYLSPGIVDETLSAQFYRMAPPGVTMVRTSLELKDVTVEEVNAAVARTEKASAELGKYRPDCIVFGGSPTVAVPGHGFEKVIVDKIEKALEANG